jgi:hypothetical protein
MSRSRRAGPVNTGDFHAVRTAARAPGADFVREAVNADLADGESAVIETPSAAEREVLPEQERVPHDRIGIRAMPMHPKRVEFLYCHAGTHVAVE